MANTWTLYNAGISFSAGKTMGGILNENASRVLRIRRVGLLNTQTAGVTGQICRIDFIRHTATATWTPTSVSPMSHDTNNSALSSVTAGNSGTLATSGSEHTFRRVIWSSDEPALSSATADEWECLVPLNIIFDAGYGDDNVQALALREDEAAEINCNSGTAGLLDSWIEFTDEAS
jgi:hypothetical protein